MTMTAVSTEKTRPFAAQRPLLLGFLTLAVLGGGLFGWGALETIAGAVIATGQIEVETRGHVVEHIDGGTVGAVLVRDGDRVEAGDVLIRLDDTLLRSEEAILEAELAELIARRNRLEAEFRDTDAVSWDAELVSLAANDPAVREILDGQRRLFEARRSSRARQVAQLAVRIKQTGKQIAGLKAQAKAVKRQNGFIVRERDAQRYLFEKGLAPIDRLLELEREMARLNGEAGDITAKIAEAGGRIAEIKIQILRIGTERVEQAEAEAREAQARENEVRERLASVRGRLGRMEVRAPVTGEIFGMTVFALGEVVRPGEAILHIVPADTDLIVRAQLEPIHIDQVWRGQEAVLLFSAFPARTTPSFEGRVIRVSADAAHDERTGLAWYEVEVRMGRAIEAESGLAGWAAAVATVAGWLPETAGDWLRDRLAADDAGAAATPGHARDLVLAPGMPVEVHLRTGERSPLSYLAKPLTDYFSRSLREE